MCINTINSNISNRKRNSLKAETEKAIATTSTASAATTKSSKTASPALDVAQVEVVVYSAAFVPVVVAVSDAESVTATSTATIVQLAAAGWHVCRRHAGRRRVRVGRHAHLERARRPTRSRPACPPQGVFLYMAALWILK